MPPRQRRLNQRYAGGNPPVFEPKFGRTITRLANFDDTQTFKGGKLAPTYADPKTIKALLFISASKRQKLARAYYNVNGPRPTTNVDVTLLDSDALRSARNEEKGVKDARLLRVLVNQRATRSALFQRMLEFQMAYYNTKYELNLSNTNSCVEAFLQTLFRYDCAYYNEVTLPLHWPIRRTDQPLMTWDKHECLDLIASRDLKYVGGALDYGYSPLQNTGATVDVARPLKTLQEWAQQNSSGPSNASDKHSLVEAMCVRMYIRTSPTNSERISYRVTDPSTNVQTTRNVDAPDVILQTPFSGTDDRDQFREFDSLSLYKNVASTTKPSTTYVMKWNKIPKEERRAYFDELEHSRLYTWFYSDHVTFYEVRDLWQNLDGRNQLSVDDAVVKLYTWWHTRLKLACDAASEEDGELRKAAVKIDGNPESSIEAELIKVNTSIQANVDQLEEAIGIPDYNERQTRISRWLGPFSTLFNCMLMGDPGVGKSYSAAFYAQAITSLGFIAGKSGPPKAFDESDFTTLDKSQLIAGYLGQTAGLVKGELDANRGKVVFIDEVYSLLGSSDKDPNLPDAYGQEFADVLTNELTLHPLETIVCVAGYKQPLKERFLNANPGLERRFLLRCELQPNMQLYIKDTLKRVGRGLTHLKKSKWEVADKNTIESFLNALADNQSGGAFEVTITGDDYSLAFTKMCPNSDGKVNEFCDKLHYLFPFNRTSVGALAREMVYILSAPPTRPLDKSKITAATQLLIQQSKTLTKTMKERANQATNGIDDSKARIREGLETLKNIQKVIDQAPVRPLKNRSSIDEKIVVQSNAASTKILTDSTSLSKQNNWATRKVWHAALELCGQQVSSNHI